MPTRQFCLFFILLCAVPIIAQDNEPVENFGRVLLTFEINIEDDDFSYARNIAAPQDLSRFYITGGDGGIIHVFDDKGNPDGTIEMPVETIIEDVVVDSDNRLFVLISGSIYIFEPDGTFVREIPGSLATQYYSTLTASEDGTLYATQFFGGDRLFHIYPDGTPVEPVREDFFGNLTGEDIGIFDLFTVGLDGFLYYYSRDEESFYQLDESGELLNTYSDIDTGPGILQNFKVDTRGQILIGNSFDVQIFGAKEALVNILTTGIRESVSEFMFADDGQLVILQRNNVTVIQYGPRDDGDTATTGD